MIKVNIFSNNKLWDRYISNPSYFIKKKIKILNKKFKKFEGKIIYCTILLSGDNEIRKLNKEFRKKNKTTDILSFPFYKKRELAIRLKKDKEIYLGDIIINFKRIKHKNTKHSFISEFNRLWVHGLVHLFGYDHKKEKDYINMNRIEKKFISYLN